MRGHAHTEVLVAACCDLETVPALRRDYDVALAALAGGSREVTVALTDTLLAALPVPRAEALRLNEVSGLQAATQRAHGGAPEMVPEESVEGHDEGAVDAEDAVQLLPCKVPHVHEAENAAAWAHPLCNDVVIAGRILTPLPKRGGIVLLEGRWLVGVQGEEEQRVRSLGVGGQGYHYVCWSAHATEAQEVRLAEAHSNMIGLARRKDHI
mmetsp:Transcript_115897/g.259082  ORF Transcript_115897/g.259082 Transcript_115897/m.259082 type:complete len:210 (-) Transcript_115897:250-879(-)